MCDFILKEKSFNLPNFFIILFDFSSLPIGTSSCAVFGKIYKNLLSLSCAINWSFDIFDIFSEISFDFSKLDLSFDLDKTFSCSSFSFSIISFLFLLSKLSNVSNLNSKFLSSSFFYNYLCFFLNL